MKFSKDLTSDELSVDINITSVIDIVLCLLFFFMVTATFINSSGIQVNLPKAATQEVQQSATDVTVTINEQGEMFFKNKPLTLPALSAELRDLQSKSSAVTLVVKADTNVFHGKVVEVLDTAKKAGVGRIAIATIR